MSYPQPEHYLEKQTVNDVFGRIKESLTSEGEFTKKYITYKEEYNKLLLLKKISESEFLDKMKRLDEESLKILGDYVHHANPIFDRFYDVLNERFSKSIKSVVLIHKEKLDKRPFSFLRILINLFRRILGISR